jgi:hypothetical protein
VRRRRSLRILLLALVVAAWLTGRTFDTVPGSSREGVLTFALGAVLLGGAYASGGWPVASRRGRRVVRPALTAVTLFAAFVVLRWLTSWVEPVTHGADGVLARARAGSTLAVVAGAAFAGVAEEVFYRGAVFERVRLPVLTATLWHMAATLPAGNVALTLAAGVLGLVLGASRRASGGWWAPAVTHVLWSLLVAAFLA